MTLAWAISRILVTAWLVWAQHWFWLGLLVGWMVADTWAFSVTERRQQELWKR